MSQGQINAGENKQTNTTDVSNGPSKCEITYMKLVADVYKDIADLSVKKKYTEHRQDCSYLFDKSSAIRKLVVFLANEDLDHIRLVRNITNNKMFRLFQVALQPAWSPISFYDKSVKIRSISEDIQGKVKPGFDEVDNIVYYDQGTFPTIKDDRYNGFVADNAQFLSEVVEAIKTVINENKTVQESFKDNNGVVQDLLDLSDTTKKNMREILVNCLKEKKPEIIKDPTFGQKLAKLWNAFLNFLGLGEKVTAQNKIIPEMKDKRAVRVLSNFLANANTNNVDKTENQHTK